MAPFFLRRGNDNSFLVLPAAENFRGGHFTDGTSGGNGGQMFRDVKKAR